MNRTNLLVMHADPIVSAGIVAALGQHPAFNVTVHGAATFATDAGAADIVVADYSTALRLADRDVRRSLGLAGEAKILAVTPSDREADIRRAIEAGVFGYLLGGGPLSELIEGATALANGLRYMSPSVASRMAESMTRAALTSRELEVLQLVASGRPNKVIARDLHIVLGTVKSHVSAIMAKLGARSRTQAARIAAARGLLEDAPDPVVSTAGRSRPLDRERGAMSLAA